MKRHNRYLLSTAGTLIQLPALMAIPTLVVGIAFAEWALLLPVIAMGLLSVGVGKFLLHCFRRQTEQTKSASMSAVALSWLIVAILCAIPFWGGALLFGEASETMRAFCHPLNALFESMSGITSTGLSVALRPSELPHLIQWWRSFLEWIGGVGVVVLALLLVHPGGDVYQLYAAEARNQNFAETMRGTVRQIWWIYFLFTLASIALYLLEGMPWWEAVNHGMTVIATGGFTITDESFAGYSPLIQLSTIFLILVGALSFRLHYQIIRKHNANALFSHTQVRLFFALFLGGFLFLLLLSRSQQSAPFVAMLFQWSSALGTCGFSTVPIASLSPAILLVLVLGMIIGGASGSTTGGIKLNRLAWLFKGVAAKFHAIRAGQRAPRRFLFDGERIGDKAAGKNIHSAAVLLLLWILALLSASLILLTTLEGERPFVQILFECASALGNVGLSTGLTHPGLAATPKIALILLMWFGRLEIIAVLVLLFSPWKMATRKIG